IEVLRLELQNYGCTLAFETLRIYLKESSKDGALVRLEDLRAKLGVCLEYHCDNQRQDLVILRYQEFLDDMPQDSYTLLGLIISTFSRLLDTNHYKEHLVELTMKFSSLIGLNNNELSAEQIKLNSTMSKQHRNLNDQKGASSRFTLEEEQFLIMDIWRNCFPFLWPDLLRSDPRATQDVILSPTVTEFLSPLSPTSTLSRSDTLFSFDDSLLSPRMNGRVDSVPSDHKTSLDYGLCKTSHPVDSHKNNSTETKSAYQSQGSEKFINLLKFKLMLLRESIIDDHSCNSIQPSGTGNTVNTGINATRHYQHGRDTSGSGRKGHKIPEAVTSIDAVSNPQPTVNLSACDDSSRLAPMNHRLRQQSSQSSIASISSTRSTLSVISSYNGSDNSSGTNLSAAIEERRNNPHSAGATPTFLQPRLLGQGLGKSRSGLGASSGSSKPRHQKERPLPLTPLEEMTLRNQGIDINKVGEDEIASARNHGALKSPANRKQQGEIITVSAVNMSKLDGKYYGSHETKPTIGSNYQQSHKVTCLEILDQCAHLSEEIELEFGTQLETMQKRCEDLVKQLEISRSYQVKLERENKATKDRLDEVMIENDVIFEKFNEELENIFNAVNAGILTNDQILQARIERSIQ
ncbi:hypothetical protein BGZ76_003053, partial [Entomortierella beljakovae]